MYSLVVFLRHVRCLHRGEGSCLCRCSTSIFKVFALLLFLLPMAMDRIIFGLVVATLLRIDNVGYIWNWFHIFWYGAFASIPVFLVIGSPIVPQLVCYTLFLLMLGILLLLTYRGYSYPGAGPLEMLSFFSQY